MPPWGGAPRWRASSRTPNCRSASARGSPIAVIPATPADEELALGNRRHEIVHILICVFSLRNLSGLS